MEYEVLNIFQKIDHAGKKTKKETFEHVNKKLIWQILKTPASFSGHKRCKKIFDI